jgi:hypothetical protein
MARARVCMLCVWSCVRVCRPTCRPACLCACESVVERALTELPSSHSCNDEVAPGTSTVQFGGAMLHPKCYRCAGPCQMQLSVGVTVYTHHAAPWCKRCFAADVVSCHAQLYCAAARTSPSPPPSRCLGNGYTGLARGRLIRCGTVDGLPHSRALSPGACGYAWRRSDSAGGARRASSLTKTARWLEWAPANSHFTTNVTTAKTATRAFQLLEERARR